ncbi:MAG: trypsin-like serine protease [Bdellovibrionales bacterium]|nr:trypsin-like serine protease [Bdellovibrionales bacterium]
MHFPKFLLIAVLPLLFVACTKDPNSSSSGDSNGPRSFCDSQNRVTNGQVCSDPSRSAVVMLALADRTGQLTSLCSGALLTSEHVLTAAHCLDRNLGTFGVFVDETGNFDFIEAAETTIHPDWISVPGNPHDIGVVRLKRPISSREFAPLLLSKDIQKSDMLEIYGYGLDENDEAGTLRQGRMKVNSIETDGNIFANFEDTGMNICSGDSGGPVASIGKSGIGIVGVNSAGSAFGCLERSQALFVGVQGGKNLDFINRLVPQVRVR